MKSQKSFSRSSHLAVHYKTSAHLKRINTKNIEHSSDKSTLNDCGETIKIEDIKEEINEEKSYEDLRSVHQETENSNICEDFKEEINEDESVEDPTSIHQKFENSNVCADIKKEIKEEKNVDVPSLI